MDKRKLISPNECTLCMACVNICPQKAIELSFDEFGYEKLVVDESKCINCYLCSEVCKKRTDVERNLPKKCYAAQTIDENKLDKSASGGAFQMLAEIVLENGGICYGCHFDKSDNYFSAKHIRIDDKQDLYKILSSKYIPSIIGDIFKQVKNDLQNDLTVLFCGTPCQVQGLKAFLDEDYKNLITCDLVCHGIASSKLFNDYINTVENNHNIKITDYFFRDKSVSWGSNFCYKYYKKNSKSKTIHEKHCPREESSYSINYLKGNISRENCYSCTLSNTNRVSDFTLGDYWGIELEHPEFIYDSQNKMRLSNGISCILANTEKALAMIEQLNSKMVIHNVSLETITAHNDNLVNPSEKGAKRGEILNIYKDSGYEELDKIYQKEIGNKILLYRIKNALKAHLPDKIRIFIYKTPMLRKIIFHG